MHSVLQTTTELTSCLPELYTTDMEERTMASELGTALGIRRCQNSKNSRILGYTRRLAHEDYHVMIKYLKALTVSMLTF